MNEKADAEKKLNLTLSCLWAVMSTVLILATFLYIGMIVLLSMSKWDDIFNYANPAMFAAIVIVLVLGKRKLNRETVNF